MATVGRVDQNRLDRVEVAGLNNDIHIFKPVAALTCQIHNRQSHALNSTGRRSPAVTQKQPKQHDRENSEATILRVNEIPQQRLTPK
jgi:hypothetical protein